MDVPELLEEKRIGSTEVKGAIDAGEFWPRLSYLSETAGLETDGERINLLKGLVDKMIGNAGIDVHLHIIQSGYTPNAYVTRTVGKPGYDIFINQAMINICENLDQLGVILAHEVGHILRGHLDRGELDRNKNELLAVDWLQELEADFIPELMVKAGLNPLVGAKVFDNIGKGERAAAIYLPDDARSTFITAAHKFIEIETSNNPAQDLPKGFLVPELQLTPLEKAKVLIEDEKWDVLLEFVDELHFYDQIEVIRIMSFRYNSTGLRSRIDISTKVFQEAQTKIESTELTEADLIALFINISNAEVVAELINLSEIGIVEVIEGYAASLVSLNQNSWIFSYSHLENSFLVIFSLLESDSSRILEYLSQNFDVSSRLIVESLLALSKHSKNYDSEYWDDGGHGDSYEDRITGTLALLLYLMFNHVGFTKDIKDQVKTLLEELKAGGVGDIKLVKDKFRLRYHPKEFSDEQVDEYANFLFPLVEDVWSEEKIDVYTQIDQLFEDSKKDKYFDLKSFTWESSSISKDIRTESLDLQQLIEHVLEKVEALEYQPSISYLEYLNGVDRKGRFWQDGYTANIKDIEFAKISVSIAILTRLIPKSPELDAFLTGVASKCNNFVEGLTMIQRLNLASMFIGELGTSTISYYNFGNPISPTLSGNSSQETLFEIPLVVELLLNIQLDETFSLAELNVLLETEFGGEARWRMYSEYNTNNLFSDYSPEFLLVGSIIRQRIYTSIRDLEELPDSELIPLFDILVKYFPDRNLEITQVHSRLSRMIIASDLVGTQDKIEMVLRHIDRLNPQLVIDLASEIEFLEDFEAYAEKVEWRVRDKFDMNAGTIGKVIKAENSVSNSFDSNPEILATIDPEKGRENSTMIAVEWCRRVLINAIKNGEFNPEQLTISGGIQLTNSLADAFTSLELLPFSAREALALKILIDYDGLLKTSEGRELLIQHAIQGLELEPGSFVEESLASLIRTAETRFIAYPAAHLLGPLLFSGMSIGSIDIQAVLDAPVRASMLGDEQAEKISDVLPEGLDLGEILGRSGREMHRYKSSKLRDIEVLQNSYESAMEEFRLIIDKLGRLLPKEADSTFEGDVTPSDKKTESLVRFVEGVGATGARGLQLSADSVDMSENVYERVASARDANQGMNAFVFRQNLVKETQKDSKLGTFIDNNHLEVGKYVGGGSLYSVYGGEVQVEELVNGRIEYVTKEVVIKILNPNVEAFITTSSDMARTALRDIESNSISQENRAHAGLAVQMLDLSEEWCLMDVEDENFEIDDQLFRQALQGLDLGLAIEVQIPKVLFSSRRVIIEEKAPGVTANQYVLKHDIQQEKKAIVTRAIKDVFEYQLAIPTSIDGADVHVIHSDTHLGNYMIHEKEDGAIILSIIDRSLYLKIPSEDVRVYKLLLEGKQTEFLNSFISLLIKKQRDAGAKIGRIESGIIRATVLKVAVQNANQSPVLLLQSIINELKEKKIKIGLDSRLMIKNMIGLQREVSRYQA